MLFTADGTLFTTSRASYSDTDPDGLHRQPSIYLQIVLPFAQNIGVYALVDTGAPYCIFNSSLLAAAEIDFTEGESVTLSTRAGRIDGKIQRLPITLAAEDGDPLTVDASVFVTEAWQHGHFLGYAGFFERLRFAIDPLSNTCYFGSVG
jgi:hypothetical protein